jgi:hypothetical protein
VNTQPVGTVGSSSAQAAVWAYFEPPEAFNAVLGDFLRRRVAPAAMAGL